MNLASPRRHRPLRGLGIILVTLIAIVASACAIPTEDQPQPIDRDLPTTSVPEVP